MWKTLLHRLLARLGFARGQSPALLARLGLVGGRPSGQATPAKKPEPYRWRAEISFDAVTIGGETPSATIRKSLAEAAGADRREVKDHSEVRADPPAGWEAAARCGIEVLGWLRTGQVFVANNRLTIDGVARDDAGYEKIRSLRGGKGERGFSVSAAGVSEPIPAAPLGPPPPEAMPEKPAEKKPARKKGSTTSLTRSGTSAKKTAGRKSAASRARSSKATSAKSGDVKAAAKAKTSTASKPASARRSGAANSKRPTAAKSSSAQPLQQPGGSAEIDPGAGKRGSAAKPRSRRKSAPAAPVRTSTAAAGAAPGEPPADGSTD